MDYQTYRRNMMDFGRVNVNSGEATTPYMKTLILLTLILLICSQAHAWERGSGFNAGDLKMQKNSIQLGEVDATPATPPSDTIKIYGKDSNGTTTIYTLDSGGSETTIASSGSLQFSTAESPVTDAVGECSYDTNAGGAGRGALQCYDGTASTYVVAVDASDTCNAGQVVKCDGNGVNTWENDNDSSGVTATDTHILYSDGADNPVGDADFTWNKTTNIATATGGFQSGAPPNPTLTLKDSNGTDADINGQIDGNLTDTGSCTEDFDIFIKQQIAGVETTSATFDADGNVTIARLETDATGETNLEARLDIAGDVSSTGMSTTVIGSDKILESMLKAVDAAADEECLTREETTGDFEWQACGSGTDTNADKEFFWPASSTLPLEPADSIPPIAKDAGTNVDLLPIDFDSAADECRSVTLKVQIGRAS